SEIIRADEPVRTDLSLHAKIPLIDVGVLHRLRIYRIRSTKREERIAQSNRKRIASRRPQPRIVKAARRGRQLKTAGIRRIHENGSGLLRIRQFIEDAVRRAYRHAAVAFRIPGKTEPRRELNPSVVAKLETRNAGIARKLKAGRSRWIRRAVHAAIECRLVEESGVTA